MLVQIVSVASDCDNFSMGVVTKTMKVKFRRLMFARNNLYAVSLYGVVGCWNIMEGHWTVRISSSVGWKLLYLLHTLDTSM